MAVTIVMLPANRQQSLMNKGQNLLGVPDALQKLGYKVEFLDVHDRPLNPLAGRPSLFASIDPVRALAVLLRHRRAMAIVSYYQSGVLLVLALRRLVGFKPPVAIIDIGDDIGWRIRTRIVAYCIRRADAVFTFASDQAEYLRNKYDAPNVRFLRQQVDTRFFAPLDGEGDYVLAVGDDISRDYETMLRALSGQGVPLLLRTSLVHNDPAQFSNVRVLAHRLDDTGLRALYRNAKIVVLPLKDMLHPGGITTLLEAFSCGKPVVACNSRGVRDYLVDGENCLVVPCGDADALRAAVMRLDGDANLRARLGRGARAYAETELSQDCHARKLAEALCSLRPGRAA